MHYVVFVYTGDAAPYQNISYDGGQSHGATAAYENVKGTTSEKEKDIQHTLATHHYTQDIASSIS